MTISQFSRACSHYDVIVRSYINGGTYFSINGKRMSIYTLVANTADFGHSGPRLAIASCGHSGNCTLRHWIQSHNSSIVGTLSTTILCGACGAYDVTTHFHLDDVIWVFPKAIFGLSNESFGFSRYILSTQTSIGLYYYYTIADCYVLPRILAFVSWYLGYNKSRDMYGMTRDNKTQKRQTKKVLFFSSFINIKIIHII